MEITLGAYLKIYVVGRSNSSQIQKANYYGFSLDQQDLHSLCTGCVTSLL